MPRITPNLWFDSESLEAAEFYVSVFPNSEITNIDYYGEAGPGPVGSVLTRRLRARRPGVHGASTAARTSRSTKRSPCWSTAPTRTRSTTTGRKLTDGGEESQCGWLKDRYGVSWQVVPSAAFAEMMSDPDPARVKRAMQAVLGMKKIDLAAIRAAADQA